MKQRASLARFSAHLGVVVAALLATPASAFQVIYTTADNAYVDAGRDDGLEVGQRIDVVRRRKKVGPCEIVEVASHRAMCRGDRLEAGDRFTIPGSAAAAARARKPAPAKPRQPLPSASVQAARLALVQQAPIEPVPYTGVSGGVVLRGTTTLRTQVWGITSTPGGVFVRPSIDASLRAGFGWGFAQASLRVVGDVYAPADQRFRPGELVELYVWGLSAGLNRGLVVAEVGRFYAKTVAGTLLVDGAQVGLRLLDDTVELGVYAGAIPELLTIAPSLDRLTAGTYLGVDIPLGDQLTLLHRLRAGAISSADFATVRGDAEAQLQMLWKGLLTVGGSARGVLGVGGAPSVVGGRGDLELSLLPGWRLSTNYRYFGAPGLDWDTSATPLPVNAAHHGTLSTSYEVLPNLAIGVISGAGFDDATEALRGYAGPEIVWNSVFGPGSGLELGYLEEFFEWPGRSGWLSARFTVFDSLRWINRLSYFETEALGDSYREAGLMTLVDAPILPWLSLRGRGYGQQGLPSIVGDKRAAPTVLMVDISLSGSL